MNTNGSGKRPFNSEPEGSSTKNAKLDDEVKL